MIAQHMQQLRDSQALALHEVGSASILSSALGGKEVVVPHIDIGVKVKDVFAI